MAREIIKVNKEMFNEQWTNNNGIVTHKDRPGETYKFVRESKTDVFLNKVEEK